MAATQSGDSIFITGATGFVGSYVLRWLLHCGYTNITALRRPTSRLDLVNDVAHQVQWVAVDLDDVWALSDALSSVHTVIHAAAVVSFDRSDADHLERINVRGTENILNAALARSVERFVHISSVAALGTDTERKVVTERTRWNDETEKSLYAKSKLRAELEVWRAQAEGLSTVILSPAVVLGAGYWNKGSASIFPKIQQKISFYPAGGTGFVDVRDVARFVEGVLRSDVEEENYILSAENWSFQQLIAAIAAELEVAPPRKQLPNWLAQIGWRADWVRQWLTGVPRSLTRETVAALQQTIRYDAQKSLRHFPAFQYTPLQQTIADTTAAYLTSTTTFGKLEFKSEMGTPKLPVR